MQQRSTTWHCPDVTIIVLVSHYSVIGDTISCDAPYIRDRLQRQVFLPRYLPSKACLWIVIDHFHGKKWGCSSDGLRYHRKHIATGVLLHQSRDRGRHFGRVTKIIPDKKVSSMRRFLRIGSCKNHMRFHVIFGG